ncbi:unnamed protein product [Prunus armeniaca]|uniref:RNase H type-1 domain-containing protein n=1 Tax=Prunus armeniaca TaxID=36596 RepID=A0A6J5XNX2_PRUAR|nr:unnamed protein product [Prunus armeniaca]
MSSHVPATNIVRHWSPPNGNFVKINVGGAVNLLIGFRAILGLQIASQMGHRYVILEMDAKEIIMNLQTYEQSWSVEGALVDEVMGLFNRFAHISCHFAPRECN